MSVDRQKNLLLLFVVVLLEESVLALGLPLLNAGLNLLPHGDGARDLLLGALLVQQSNAARGMGTMVMVSLYCSALHCNVLPCTVV